MPMSGIKSRPCLVLESPPETTGDGAGTTSQVPMSRTKDQPSLLDDSQEVPKVNNPSLGGESPPEGGSATLPIFLVSPRSTTSLVGEPQKRALPN